MDRFVIERLPPSAAWPELLFELDELRYPARLNCAVALLDDALAAGCGDRPCFIGSARTWTYREVAERVAKIGNVLRRHGAGLGTRVLLRGPNSPMTLACWLAIVRIGAVAVATMPLLRARELATVIEKAAIAFALCDARLADELATAATSARHAPDTLYFAPDESGSLDREMRDVSDACAAADTAQDDVALIAFTSGTTGVPKGCVHFHRDVLAAADTFSRHVLKPNADDVFCASPPVAFTFGLGGALIFPMHARAATVLAEVASPHALHDAIARHAVTVCFSAPTAYRALSNCEPSGLASLRRCVSAGEALSAETRRAFESATGLSLIDGIGSTEMMHIFISAADDDIRPGATGKPVPGFRAAVFDDAGRELPRGSTGQLGVKGPTGCRYLDDARQAEYVRNGWNITGDTYFLDHDGYYWFKGRSDDMIVSAGYNISGLEVEAVLSDYPDIVECAVVGAPNAERGHIVKAFVVLKTGVEGDDALVRRLQAFVKANIAPYKYPRAVAFVKSLPRTETGKLQRYRLRVDHF
ncbi:MAG: AMP-binding protein [Candidatus Eremiobacteraeota bacterium]|nr:AMP-binding protein [Candidatus Eremiobacteraeota bacterium]